MKSERLLELEKYVVQKGFATMTELQTRFGVSMNTVRRDVAELAARGVFDKVYGGVCMKRAESVLTPYEVRRSVHEEEKRRVGLCAAGLVRDGDVVFVDSGTTTLQIIDGLRGLNHVTIVTNNLEAILRALPCGNITIIALSGQIRRRTNSMSGADAAEALRRYPIHTAFLAATGLSALGATNSSDQEYDVKRAAVQMAENVVLLVDHHKFGKTGPMTFARPDELTAVVSDGEPDDREIAQTLAEAGVRLIIAG